MKYNIYHKIIITNSNADEISLETLNSLMIYNDVDSITDTATITIP